MAKKKGENYDSDGGDDQDYDEEPNFDDPEDFVDDVTDEGRPLFRICDNAFSFNAQERGGQNDSTARAIHVASEAEVCHLLIKVDFFYFRIAERFLEAKTLRIGWCGKCYCRG